MGGAFRSQKRRQTFRRGNLDISGDSPSDTPIGKRQAGLVSHFKDGAERFRLVELGEEKPRLRQITEASRDTTELLLPRGSRKDQMCRDDLFW